MSGIYGQTPSKLSDLSLASDIISVNCPGRETSQKSDILNVYSWSKLIKGSSDYFIPSQINHLDIKIGKQNSNMHNSLWLTSAK